MVRVNGRKACVEGLNRNVLILFGVLSSPRVLPVTSRLAASPAGSGDIRVRWLGSPRQNSRGRTSDYAFSLKIDVIEITGSGEDCHSLRPIRSPASEL